MCSSDLKHAYETVEVSPRLPERNICLWGSSMSGSPGGRLGVKVSSGWLGYSGCGISILIRGKAGRLN